MLRLEKYGSSNEIYQWDLKFLVSKEANKDIVLVKPVILCVVFHALFKTNNNNLKLIK